MTETLTTTFDEHALAALPEAAGFTAPLRKQAFEEFSALPIPSQETEEWRYTDLSDFALDFAPYTPGGRAANLDGQMGAASHPAGTPARRLGCGLTPGRIGPRLRVSAGIGPASPADRTFSAPASNHTPAPRVNAAVLGRLGGLPTHPTSLEVCRPA